MAVDWTPEKVDSLIAFWNECLPTSEIGRRLGITKNAVVGKAHRLGLTKRQSPIRRKPNQTEIVKLEGLGVGMCSWPTGEPGTDDFRFCGAPVIPGKPYCGEHCARAYVKAGKDRKEPEPAS